ncbi:distal tail protein [Lactococcus phage LP1502b]|uniref:Distal tail protein n=2 Tax=Skunavirus LP1502a TaxID=2845413 RepID=A0A2K8IIQ8_9CAUD|nr:distal tail protein [Lactococcus phage LP1502b]ATE84582.1 distal tail protein [Lactococcus phage LP1502c]
MVRQYKIHTNLDGTDDKVWDVTNGKVRFYQPSNLGLQSTNNIWQINGIGVMGTRSIKQPQIEFKLETFGESLEENYRLMKDFVNDILSKKFVTLEYQTEIFQVYADLALADVTKTEGYGKNGTFSEKITFDIITKWYTYENLTFEKIQNGKVISGKSKIYGGYKGNETPLQNYNRLKASPSLNLPNLNLLKNTRTLTATSTASWWNTLFNSSQIYDSSIKSKTGVSAMNFSFNVYIPLNTKVGGAVSLQLKGQTYQAHGDVGTNDFSTIVGEIWYNIEQSDLGKTIRLSFPIQIDTKYKNFDSALADTDSITIRQIKDTSGLVYSKLKLEEGSTATPWLPSASEVTTADISEYFGYNYIANQAYTYYGETNIDRLSRWDIKDEIFSFMGMLYPKLPKTPAGVRFLDDNGNEYTAIVFKTEQVQKYILVNTDVNDEVYQGWNGTTSLNLFPVMDFERYRTRIIEHGQMELINLTKAEFKVKRKADFV